MGGGDVKMLAMVGAFLGWQLVIVTLVLSSIAGALIGLLVIASRRGGMQHALPVRDVPGARRAGRVALRRAAGRLVSRLLTERPSPDYAG